MFITSPVKRIFLLVALSHYFVCIGDKAYNLLAKHFEIVGFSSGEIGFTISFTGLGGMLLLPVFTTFGFFIIWGKTRWLSDTYFGQR